MSNPRPCKWCGKSKEAHGWAEPLYRGVERTEPLRAVGHAEWKRWLRTHHDSMVNHVPEPAVPVRVLREYLDERTKTLRRQRAELHSDIPEEWRWYYNGRISSLDFVRERFCGEN